MNDKTISWRQFEQIELRVGTITEAYSFPEAHKPAYKLTVDFGEEIGLKKSSAQITDLYSKEDLIGKQVIGVVNFPPKQIGPFISECLVTGFYNEQEKVVLAIPDQEVSNGLKLN
ncbi:tRNA-binding protein [Fodinibius salsisoli]|uniref:tRNA-binding protein n=1 Tax=Fodinibius salsisoli TaxID=2820877 RepID=A0ABT3PNY1_9BACT|nr:tRNA-binding protein [Fodinibius salsisoli]MCW9707567.1 tRNA-binding protein [Fodinibius salsisoli]